MIPPLEKNFISTLTFELQCCYFIVPFKQKDNITGYESWVRYATQFFLKNKETYSVSEMLSAENRARNLALKTKTYFELLTQKSYNEGWDDGARFSYGGN